MLTIDLQMALWAVGIIFVAGGFQAAVLVRLGSIEKKLGNGTPGVFVRRDELEQMVKNKDESHVRLHARDDELAARLHDLEAR